ncbi:MAG: alpha/beta hydrolase-fold protein [Ferruginibacter sp.]
MMKKYFIPLSLLLISFSAIAQTKKEIITADVVTINSKILKEIRTAWIYNPGNKNESKIYPVIYVLDGESHFKSVVAMVE